MGKRLIMLRGLPASGKSTKAKELLKEFRKGNAHRVNSDELRLMLDNGEWSPNNEKFVNRVRDHIVRDALSDGLHVIVDNCNLAPKHETHLRQIAKDCGGEFEIVDFTHVPVDVCIERDAKREASVGKKVITDMYNQFLYKPVVPPARDPALPDAIIVDIDGTIALVEPGGRSHYDWKRVGEDSVRWPVVHAIMGMAAHTGASIMFVSGRDAVCYNQTEKWIREQAKMPVESANMLRMRPMGDMRKDAIVKGEIYENHIKGKFNVLAVYDDRRSIVAYWRSIGLGDRLFDVGDGTEY